MYQKHNAVAEYLRQLEYLLHSGFELKEVGSNSKLSLQKWHTLGENCFVSPKICLADEKLNNMIKEEKLSSRIWK